MNPTHIGLPRLAWRSLRSRRLSALLVIIAIALSVVLLLAVERIRSQARTSFANTIAGTDLIVGARTGNLNLLLYSVFRLGDATPAMSWNSYQQLAALPQVAWRIPIALGDSHRGYAVVGTSSAYFSHYRHGRQQPLQLAAGRAFGKPLEAVLGAEVARALDYRIGSPLILAHGRRGAQFTHHDQLPFVVVGILAATGTPVDRSVHVPLEGLEAVHRRGATPTNLEHYDLTPRNLSAVLVGLHQRTATFAVQRHIQAMASEPLSAILPGLTLQQLWDQMAVAEQLLQLVSAMVAVVGLFVLLVALLMSLNERRREMALLRALGAAPHQLLALVVGEALLLAAGGCALGVASHSPTCSRATPVLESRLGLNIAIWPPTRYEALLLLAILAAALLAALFPAWRAYRRAVADGLILRS